MNPWKFLKLMWFMRQVSGGYERGNPTYVADAFIRAGVFKEADREEVRR